MSNFERNLPDELDIIGNVSPVNSLQQKGIVEHRREARYMASWKVVTAIGGEFLHEGKLKDISLHGAAILIERSVTPGTCLTLHIHVHSLMGCAAPKILVIYGLTLYTVHDVHHRLFRIGINFIKFEQKSDRTYLESRLTNHHSKTL